MRTSSGQRTSDVPADADAPRSHEDARVFWHAAYDASQTRQEQSITLPWITALEWTAKGEIFSLTADLGDLLAKHGKGVYSLIVWGSLGRPAESQGTQAG